MFVNCSQNGQLGLYQNQCTLRKIHSLSTGGAHSRLLPHIASPTSPPFVGTQLTALFHTQPLLKCLVYSIAAPRVYCAFFKPQPCTPSTWPLSPSRMTQKSACEPMGMTQETRDHNYFPTRSVVNKVLPFSLMVDELVHSLPFAIPITVCVTE